METIGFSLIQLIEEAQQGAERFVYPDANSFKNIPDSFEFRYEQFYYEIIVQKHTDYIWFYFNYGNPIPRDANLTNIDTGQKKKNPRENTKTELLKQLFCLYSYSKEILYISNYNKRKLFETVLKEKTSTSFMVKSISKTKDEFIELIKKISEISFTEARNLFNENSKERQALIDLTGTDAPDDFTITAKYSNQMTKKIKNFILKLINTKSKTNSALKDLIIRGTDEDNFSVIFNNDIFIRKVNIKSDKDENGRFDSKSVKDTLLLRITR